MLHSGAEGRRKLTFGKVTLQICQVVLRENLAKKFRMNAVLSCISFGKMVLNLEYV